MSYQKAFEGATSEVIPPAVLADAFAIAAEGMPPGWRVITAETKIPPRPKRRPKV